VDQLLIATIVGFSILIASMLSVELGLSVAIIEIVAVEDGEFEPRFGERRPA
jgi:hypothetical protein